MDKEIWLLLITNVLGPSLVWFFARKKHAMDAKMLELDSVERAIGIWRETAEELKVKLDNTLKLLDQLEAHNQRLKEEVFDLSKKNDLLSSRLKDVEKKIFRK
jgi:hypothetical protein